MNLALRNIFSGRWAEWRPIIAHELFPVGVAMWLGALFTLATLAVRGTVLEQMVVAHNIDSRLPFFSPPLGMFRRLILAVILGGLGAGMGYAAARITQWIVRWREQPEPAGAARPGATKPGRAPAGARGGRMAGAPARNQDEARAPGRRAAALASRRRDSHPDAPARTPIRAHEELGLSLDSAYPPVAMPDTDAMPRWNSQDPESPAHRPAAPEPSELPLALELAIEDTVAEPAPSPEPAPTPSPAPARIAPAPLAPPLAGPSAALQIAAAPLDSLSPCELTARLAAAMERRQGKPTQPASAAPAGEDAGMKGAPPAQAGDSAALLSEAMARLRALG